jgi:hypothetical protein
MPISWEFKKKSGSWGYKVLRKVNATSTGYTTGSITAKEHVKNNKTGSPGGTHFVFFVITSNSGIEFLPLSR